MISWQSLARATVVRFFSVMAAMVAMGVSGGAGFAQDWPKAEPNHCLLVLIKCLEKRTICGLRQPSGLEGARASQ